MIIPPIKKRPPGSPPIKFKRMTLPVIRTPWYRRLWRWFLRKPPVVWPTSLRETITAAPSMKAEWADSQAYVEHLERVTKKGAT